MSGTECCDLDSMSKVNERKRRKRKRKGRMAVTHTEIHKHTLYRRELDLH